MDRWRRIAGILFVLALTLLFAPSARAAAKPSRPLPCPAEEQTPDGCAGPVADETGVQSSYYSATVQVPPTVCVVQSWIPNKGAATVLGHGEIACSPSATIRLRTGIQVERWYGWQTLACHDNTHIGQTMSQFSPAAALSGIYNYRTYVTTWITAANGGTASREVPGPIVRWEFP